MKIIITTLLLAFISVTAQASEESCYKRLTQNHTQDSRTFQISIDDLDMRDYGRDYQAESIFFIRELTSI